MFIRLADFMGDDNRSRSFVVFLPTPLSAFCGEFAGPLASHVRHLETLPAKEHCWQRGDQHAIHQGSSQLQASRIDTTILVLQNPAGNALWPVTPAAVADIRANFGPFALDSAMRRS